MKNLLSISMLIIGITFLTPNMEAKRMQHGFNSCNSCCATEKTSCSTKKSGKRKKTAKKKSTTGKKRGRKAKKND